MRGIFRFGTTQPSTPAYIAPPADNREGQIKKKVKKKKRRFRGNYDTRQIEREEEEDKKRDLKKKRRKGKERIKVEGNKSQQLTQRRNTQ